MRASLSRLAASGRAFIENGRPTIVAPGWGMALVWLLGTAGIGGCTSGPFTVRGDRFNFNKVGAQSTNEQILLNLVRLRYGEPTYFVDIAMMALGMKRLGATRRAMAGAALGTLAGLFFGLPGLIIGPFAGAMVGELTAEVNWRSAGRAGFAAWIGFLIGTMAKVGLAFAMVGIFLTAWFVA